MREQWWLIVRLRCVLELMMPFNSTFPGLFFVTCDHTPIVQSSKINSNYYKSKTSPNGAISDLICKVKWIIIAITIFKAEMEPWHYNEWEKLEYPILWLFTTKFCLPIKKSQQPIDKITFMGKLHPAFALHCTYASAGPNIIFFFFLCVRYLRVRNNIYDSIHSIVDLKYG